MKITSENKNQIFMFLAFMPFLLAPLLVVEVPRALTYLPLLTVFFAAFTVKKKNLKEDIKNFRYPLFILIGFFLFISTHTFLIAQHDDAYDRLNKLLLLFLGGALLLILSKKLVYKDFQKLINWLLLICAFSSLLVFIEILSGGVLYSFLRQSSDKSPYVITVFNRSAVTITLFALTAFFLIEHKRIAHYSALILLLPMLIVTSSQSAQLAYVFAILFYVVFPFKYKWAWIFVVFAIALASLSKPFIVPYLYNDMPAFIDKIDLLRQACAGPRMEIWDYISRKVYESPLWGHGLEFTKTYNDFDTQARYFANTAVMHPHSYILQIWIEFGVLGILLALAVLGVFISFIFRHMVGKEQKTALTMLLGFLLVSLVSHGMWQSWWVSLAFMLSSLIIISVKCKKLSSST